MSALFSGSQKALSKPGIVTELLPVEAGGERYYR